VTRDVEALVTIHCAEPGCTASFTGAYGQFVAGWVLLETFVTVNPVRRWYCHEHWAQAALAKGER
jgi:hypothetical protein